MNGVLVFVSGDTSVTLNIGGQFFQTTAEVLTKDKWSILAAVCLASGAPLEKQPDGSFFIDRDWCAHMFFSHFALRVSCSRQNETRTRACAGGSSVTFSSSFGRARSPTTQSCCSRCALRPRRAPPSLSLPALSRAAPHATVAQVQRSELLPALILVRRDPQGARPPSLFPSKDIPHPTRFEGK